MLAYKFRVFSYNRVVSVVVFNAGYKRWIIPKSFCVVTGFDGIHPSLVNWRPSTFVDPIWTVCCTVSSGLDLHFGLFRTEQRLFFLLLPYLLYNTRPIRIVIIIPRPNPIYAAKGHVEVVRFTCCI